MLKISQFCKTYLRENTKWNRADYHGRCYQISDKCNAKRYLRIPVPYTKREIPIHCKGKIPTNTPLQAKPNAIGKDTWCFHTWARYQRHLNSPMLVLQCTHKHQRFRWRAAKKFHFHSQMEASRAAWLPKVNGPEVADPKTIHTKCKQQISYGHTDRKSEGV